jgi:hypothetical protein
MSYITAEALAKFTARWRVDGNAMSAILQGPDFDAWAAEVASRAQIYQADEESLDLRYDIRSLWALAIQRGEWTMAVTDIGPHAEKLVSDGITPMMREAADKLPYRRIHYPLLAVTIPGIPNALRVVDGNHRIIRLTEAGLPLALTVVLTCMQAEPFRLTKEQACAYVTSAMRADPRVREVEAGKLAKALVIPQADALRIIELVACESPLDFVIIALRQCHRTLDDLRAAVATF